MSGFFPETQCTKAITPGHTDHFSNIFSPVTLNLHLWPWPMYST